MLIPPGKIIHLRKLKVKKLKVTSEEVESEKQQVKNRKGTGNVQKRRVGGLVGEEVEEQGQEIV